MDETRVVLPYANPGATPPASTRRRRYGCIVAALAVPVLGLCALSGARTARRWADPVHRAFVVHTVAHG